jgi:hypothetical protein
MSKTRKDTVKALKKASRKAQPIPKARVVANKKREAKKNPPMELDEDDCNCCPCCGHSCGTYGYDKYED